MDFERRKPCLDVYAQRVKYVLKESGLDFNVSFKDIEENL